MKTQVNRIRPAARRGALYVIVLLSSLIVATIGLSSLQLIRLQSRTASSNSDFIVARSYARTALEIGMLKIKEDHYWRANLGNGNWLIDQTIGSGKLSLSAVDPIDNDVTKGDNHPVVLTGVGKQGAAVFKTSARLEVGPRVGSCLEVSMTSGNNLNVTSATLTSNQSLTANRDITAVSGSIVNADVEAYGSISGSTYTKARLQRTLPREMPDAGHALDYYQANGTMISAAALPTWNQSEILKNPTFENNLANWSAQTNCVLERSSAQAKSGTYSLRVTGRALSTDVAVQDIPPGALKSGNKYRLSMPILPTAIGTAKAILTLESSGDGVQTFTTPDFALTKSGSGVFAWVDLKGDITLSWTGSLTKANVSISISSNNEYYLDIPSLIDVTYPAGVYVIDKRLISPAVNPFGSANAKGIYVINCAGQDVVIGRSRIVGTLVFIDPGNGTSIQDSVAWEAAVYNFPALLTNDKVIIKLGSAGLSEAGLGINLNPPDTPYPYIAGTVNDTLTESYPSRIAGLIYSTDDLEFSGSSNINGVVIAHRDIYVAATSLTLSYGNTYMADPPPGFDVSSVKMKAVAGTWQRAVD